MKHTPGPWHVEPAKPSRWGAIEVVSGEKIVCEVMNQGNLKTTASTARLIAAAPDLLRVLVQLDQACADEGVQGMDSLLAAARAAIAKAMGGQRG